jgi:hypothetical protein
MTSIEVRHLALDYAVRSAHDSPSVESVVARAKAYETYLAGEQSRSLSDTCDLCDRPATAGAVGGDLPSVAYCGGHSHLLYADNPQTGDGAEVDSQVVDRADRQSHAQPVDEDAAPSSPVYEFEFTPAATDEFIARIVRATEGFAIRASFLRAGGAA